MRMMSRRFGAVTRVETTRGTRARGARGDDARVVRRGGDVEGDERGAREGRELRRAERRGDARGAKAERERIRGGDDVQG